MSSFKTHALNENLLSGSMHFPQDALFASTDLSPFMQRITLFLAHSGVTAEQLASGVTVSAQDAQNACGFTDKAWYLAAEKLLASVRSQQSPIMRVTQHESELVFPVFLSVGLCGANGAPALDGLSKNRGPAIHMVFNDFFAKFLCEPSVGETRPVYDSSAATLLYEAFKTSEDGSAELSFKELKSIICPERCGKIVPATVSIPSRYYELRESVLAPACAEISALQDISLSFVPTDEKKAKMALSGRIRTRFHVARSIPCLG